MPDTYEITTIADLLKVPAEKRERCMQELLIGLQLFDLAAGDIESAVLKLPMTWTDDGSRNVSLDMNDSPLLTLDVRQEDEEPRPFAQGYWCVVCGRLLPADTDGVIVHDPHPHPADMAFDDEERPQ